MNNSDSVLSTHQELLSPPLKYFVYSIYAVIAITGVTGNSLVLFVVFRKAPMRSITNMFIANLSVSDILMGLIPTVFTPINTVQDRNFSINESFCRVLSMTMGVTVYVSTLTCTAIAAERFFVIVHPFMPKMKSWLCGVIIALVWVVGIIISMPLGLYQNLQHDEESNYTLCSGDWPPNSSAEIFTIVSFLLQYVVPGSVISYCYYRISRLLKTRYQNKLGSGTMNRIKEERELQRKRRTNSMLIAMVIIFFVCWIPINVLWISVDLYFLSDRQGKDVFINRPIFGVAFFICHIVAMSSAVYNPFLYAWMNENFRKEFRSLLPFLFNSANNNNYRTEETTLKHKTNASIDVGTEKETQEAKPIKKLVTIDANPTIKENDVDEDKSDAFESKPLTSNDRIEPDLFVKEEDV